MSTKFNLSKKPEQLLLFTAIALLLAFVFSLIANIDFQDIKMFNVPLRTMLLIIPLILISLWLLYTITKKFLYSVVITRIHVFITVFTTTLILIILFASINSSQFTNDRQELIGNAMQVLFLLFVFIQLTFVANILLGLFAKRQINYS